MRPGKLDPGLLASLLGAFPAAASHGELLLGPGLGRDAAAVRLPDRYLVLAADPISMTTHRIGAAAVHVNANDVVCLGADPRWFLATILLPPAATESDARAVFQGTAAACNDLGVALVGGHTEVSDAVTRPVVAGTMVGEAPLDRFYPSTAVQPGDALIQVGHVAIEGTALLATEATAELRDAGLTPPEIAAAAALVDEPGISVVNAARALWRAPGLHTLHDPTEGGVASAALEMAQAGGVAVEVDRASTLTHPSTDRVSAALRIDPLGLLASGALLAAVAADQSDVILGLLQAEGLTAARIGRFNPTPGPDGEPAILRSPEGSRALPRFARDEALRVLSSRG